MRVGGVVARLLEHEEALEIVRADGFAPGVLERWRTFPLDADLPLSGSVAGTARRARVDRGADDQYPSLAGEPVRSGHGAWLAAPLSVEGRAIGGSRSRSRPRALRRRCARVRARSRAASWAGVRARATLDAEREARGRAERITVGLAQLHALGPRSLARGRPVKLPRLSGRRSWACSTRTRQASTSSIRTARRSNAAPSERPLRTRPTPYRSTTVRRSRSPSGPALRLAGTRRAREGRPGRHRKSDRRHARSSAHARRRRPDRGVTSSSRAAACSTPSSAASSRPSRDRPPSRSSACGCWRRTGVHGSSRCRRQSVRVAYSV